MSCSKCGGCGPIIVRPEVDLGDVTVDTGPDHELRVLCDADQVAFLRRWSIALDGTVTAVDTELDGTTSFTPVEPVGVCAPGETDESPGEQVTGHPVVLCDHDGATSTPFVRTYMLIGGQVAGVEDTDLGGAVYTVSGTVGVCPPDPDESPDEPCLGGTSTLLLCDLDTTGAANPTVTVTDTDPVPYFPNPPGPYYEARPRPGGGGALWTGGSITYGPDNDPAEGKHTIHRWAAATVQADRPACDDGTATITAAVDVQLNGPTDGVLRVGGFGLRRLADPSRNLAFDGPRNSAPAGHTQHLQVTAEVPADELAAGGVVVFLQLETFHNGEKTWTAENFTTAVEFGQADCATQFLRNVTVDCDGQVVGVDDRTLDGDPYAVQGEVGDCATIEDPTGPAAKPCVSTSVLTLCDTFDGATVPFLRHLTYTCEGTLGPVADTTLDGAEYDPEGTVGMCSGDDESPAEVELVDCGLPPDAITSGETNSGQPGEMAATDTAVPQPYGPPNFTPSAHIPLPGGGQPLWDGASLVFPAEADGTAGDGKQVYRAVAAILQADRPTCDDGTAEVTVSVHVTNDGPDRGVAHSGALFVYNAQTEMAYVPVTRAAPVGHDETLSTTLVVPAADLAAGNLMVLLELETYHVNAAGAGGPKQWTADQFVATYAYATDSCGEPAPAMRVELCGPVTIGGGMLSGSGGGSETVVATGPQVIQRTGCDDTTGDGLPDTSYVELWSIQPGPDGADPELIGFYQEGDLSQPYTPVNPVPCAAAAGECGTTQVIDLCDRIEGGSDEPPQIVRFLRHLTFDCAGALTGSVDTTPAGDPYTLQGEIGSCEPDPATCGLLDGEAISGNISDGTLVATDNAFSPRQSSETLLREQVPGGAQTLWDGGSVVFGPDGDPPGSQFIVHRWAAATLQAARPNCDDGTVQVTASVRITNDGPDAGYQASGVVALYNQDTTIVREKVTLDPPQGHTETFTFTETVAAADLASGRLKFLVELETYHHGGKSWTVDQFSAAYEYGTEGCGEEVPVSYVKVCGPITIGGGMLSAGGSSGGAGGAGGEGGSATVRQVLERKRCDDTTGDGLPDTSFVELYQLDEDGQPVRIGAYLADDLSQPYQPVSPVSCDTTVVCETADGQAGLAQLVKSCDDTCVINTSAGRWPVGTGGSLDLTPLVALQSATLTVIEGEVTVTTDAGSTTVPAGVTMTWSVMRDRDERLSTLEFDFPQDSDALVHTTHCGPFEVGP